MLLSSDEIQRPEFKNRDEPRRIYPISDSGDASPDLVVKAEPLRAG